jgi:hypothetical protein
VEGGRGDNSILNTWDGKMLIKTISKEEKKLLKKEMIKEYQKRMRDTKSMLCRIYGLFQIGVSDHVDAYVLLMKNMCDLPNNSRYLAFDLKGSTVDRQCISLNDEDMINKGHVGTVIPKLTDKVLKDKDLTLLGIKFNLSSMDARNLVTCVDEDSLFLENYFVTDYSLLLFIHKFNLQDYITNFKNSRIMKSSDGKFLFSFSIIDFLTVKLICKINIFCRFMI